MSTWQDPRNGPLPLLLLALTVVTGMVDAVSFLAFGRVFVANMTGNVVFLGFALGGVTDFSIAASLVAIATFLVGALAGGRAGSRFSGHRGRLLAVGVTIEIALVGVAVVVALVSTNVTSAEVRYALIVIMALAMGVQNAFARRLAVPDLTTTVLTQTLTGLASESALAGGTAPDQRRRIAAPIAMVIGAGIGATMVLRFGPGEALLLAWLVIAGIGAAAWRLAQSTEPWTIPRPPAAPPTERET